MKEINLNGEVKELEVIQSVEVAPVNLLGGLTNPTSNMFSSLVDDGTRTSKIKIFNAISSSENALKDNINKELAIVDVIAHPVTLISEETGKPVECLRVVLIDQNGTSYTAVSVGVVSSLQRIFAIVGTPSWVDEPVVIVPKLISTKGNKSVLTLQMV